MSACCRTGSPGTRWPPRNPDQQFSYSFNEQGELLIKGRLTTEQGQLFLAALNRMLQDVPPEEERVYSRICSRTAQALVVMAEATGYDVVLIDPREAFGSAARFPGETILHDWPDEALEDQGLVIVRDSFPPVTD